ncbi:hypothetical protein TYRP_015604 [Tyrophagus putrescentiae]|nr:hypothetical protein TYRP_015604 [Tyrophagus putrescentiae]
MTTNEAIDHSQSTGEPTDHLPVREIARFDQSSETVTETPLKLEIKTETSAKKKKVLMLRPRLMHRPPPY